MKLIQQRNDSDCMLAALAMVLGREYDDLWTPAFVAKVQAAPGCTHDLLREAWIIAGLKENRDVFSVYAGYDNFELVKKMLRGRRAVLSVPSLNNKDGHHAVAWSGTELLDPSTQRTYRWLSHVFPGWMYLFNEAAP